MEFKDYYGILGVEPEADDAAIKAAYRRLARKYHPDVSKEKDAEERFKEVAEAYQVLKDADKRADYDQLRAWRQNGQPGGQGGFEPPPGWQPSGGFSFDQDGGDFSDFFESIFGGHARAGFGQREVHRRGRDIDVELPVFLEETLGERSKTISYTLPGASGQKTLNVKIPAGVTDGERIRLRGQGAAGHGKGGAGDLYLHIRLVPHPLFDVEGHNLLVTVPVAPWEAALGVKVEVPTLDGRINLQIPANSANGRKLRIPGKGLPGKAGQGDLFAVIKVVMPPENDEQMKKLWQSLADKAGFDARAQWRQ